MRASIAQRDEDANVVLKQASVLGSTHAASTAICWKILYVEIETIGFSQLSGDIKMKDMSDV